MGHFFKRKRRMQNERSSSPEKNQQHTQNKNEEKKNSEDWEKTFLKSKDFTKTNYINQKTGKPFTFVFMSTLVDEKILSNSVLPALLEEELYQLSDIKKLLPIPDVQLSTEKSEIEKKLFNGYVMLFLDNDKSLFAFIAAQKEVSRSVSAPEIEFSVVGPKEAFVESLGQNINMVRKRMPIKELVSEEFTLGSLSKTKISILHVEGITNDEIIQTVRQRIKNIEFDEIVDSSYIVQLISDNESSPFPQLLDTERPDRVAAILAEGKIAILVDGSPHALIGPTTLIEFFSSFEDYFLNWILSSFFRLIRVFGVAFSILITPIYVAALTYHYELIPKDLLGTLINSRRVVPFPPILEALFLEITIELLREAGARLPTKVGQTIGIVGGIVLGTASVEAGLTSNVLLIFIALAALAAFTTPVYKMSNTIRLLRFPFLLMAELWGLLGITIAFCFLMTHLIRLTSLGHPFLEPLYPPRVQDLKDAFIRGSFKDLNRRPSYLRTKDPIRFSGEKSHKKKDIDE